MTSISPRHEYQRLEVEQAGPVATVWMNRPEVYNAFDETMLKELRDACNRLDADSAVRIVVVAGRGRHFSAGADLDWMRRGAAYDETRNREDAWEFAAMLQTLAQMSKPTIARVHSMAFGLGTGIAAACDMAIAADDAVFAVSEVRFGIIPAVISPYVLRAIGPRHALRFFQSAERITAKQALMIGLVNEVTPVEQLDAFIEQLAKALLAGAPLAQKAAKDLIGDIAGLPICQATSEETARRIAYQRTTAEAREGVAAFLEKRAAVW